MNSKVSSVFMLILRKLLVKRVLITCVFTLCFTIGTLKLHSMTASGDSNDLSNRNWIERPKENNHIRNKGSFNSIPYTVSVKKPIKQKLYLRANKRTKLDVLTNVSVNETMDVFFDNTDKLLNTRPNGTIVLYIKDLLQYIGEEGVKEILAHRISESKHTNKIFNARQYPLKVNMHDILSKMIVIPEINKSFKVRLNPKHKCDKNTEPLIAFVVKTSPKHADRRNAIRSTWGDENKFPEIRTVFSVGIPSDERTIQNIHKEWDEHKDILFVDYRDTYYNLTLKTISGISWSVEFCGKAKYVISVDDDMFVATDYIISYLKNLPNNIANRLYAGYKYKLSSPIRKEDNVGQYYAKYEVSYGEYKWTTYPSYVFGGLVIMSRQTANEFNTVLKYTQLFKFEDVYLGILASKLGINITHINSVDPFKQYIMSNDGFKTLMASHFYSNPKELEMAWQCHLKLIGKQDDQLSYKCAIRQSTLVRKDQLKKVEAEFKSFVSWIQSSKSRKKKTH